MRRSLTALALTAACTAAMLTAPAAARAADASLSYVTIPGYQGTALKAFLIKPAGPGPFPLLVMPSSWSVLDVEYVGAAEKLARQGGYEVVSYTSRGFWDSAGQIDVAGPQDMGDVSAIIDWALANAGADATRIGMAGISYGAGISLLAAAHDPRIKAVAAMSAWTDLRFSLYPNQTLSNLSGGVLLGAGDVTGRPGPELKQLQQAYLDNDLAPVLPLLDGRGAASVIGQINANHPAVMIANGWDDGFFAPSQLTTFFGKLTTPKRLLLQPGDHATAEGLGAVGLPNDVWTAAGKWFDHYLKGVDNGVDRQQPLQVRPADLGTKGTWTGYPSVAALGPDRRRYPLPGRVRIKAGVSTVADSGIPFAKGITEQAGIAWKIRMSQINRKAAAVWNLPKANRRTRVGGSPTLTTTVVPSARNTSLFAYLYDVGPGGEGRLITQQPYTLLGVKPGSAHTVGITLEPTDWTLAKGHHLSLVIDTMDVRYRSASSKGSTVTFPTRTHLTVPTD